MNQLSGPFIGCIGFLAIMLILLVNAWLNERGLRRVLELRKQICDSQHETLMDVARVAQSPEVKAALQRGYEQLERISHIL